MMPQKNHCKKPLLWVIGQCRRCAVFVLKAFLPYFVYALARKIYRRLISADKKEEHSASRRREKGLPTEQKDEPKRKYLFVEDFIKPTYENRRLATVGTYTIFRPYVQCLRDSFPQNKRLIFGWGNFRDCGSLSLTTFPDAIKKKKIYVSMENPLIGRALFNDVETRDSGYFRIALYNTSTFGRGDFSLPRKANKERLHTILHTTRTKMNPYRKKGEHILYALQVPEDTSLIGLDVYSAAQHDLVTLRHHTSRPIVVTSSPAMLQDKWIAGRILEDTKMKYNCLKELCENLGITFFETFEHDQDSSIFLPNCWCVVCHSSGFAVDAMLAGVPAITLHRGSFVYPICSHDLSEVENPKMPNRIPWFSRLAYCQWTLSEIKNGEVYRHFRPVVTKLLEGKPKKRVPKARLPQSIKAWLLQGIKT